MLVRIMNFCLVAVCILGVGSGCRKSPTTQSAEAPSAQPPQPTPQLESVARIHWLGKKRLAANTNAASFMSIWNMPESQRLEAQTLDKLALAPWGLPREGTNTAAIVATNPPSLLLRPLLEDLLQEECYIELRSASNQLGELAVAVRVDENRAYLWKTNLTAVLNSLAARASPITNFASHIQFLRAGNWTVIGPRHGDNGWVEELAGRLGQNSNLFTGEETNSWLETELDVEGVSDALGLGWHLPEGMPKISLTIAGEGDLVRTTGRLKFEKPLPLELDAWNVPTNLVHDPLSSFTAVRGLRFWLSSLKVWNDLHLGPPPNQFFVWAQGSLPITTFWAAPLPDASNHIFQFTEHFIHDANPWLSTNSMGQIQRTTNANAAIWGGLPFMEPYLKSTLLPEGEFIMGSVGASPFTNRPAPTSLFEQFISRTNVVAYDWEVTGARIEPDLYTIQLLRLLFQKAQIPTDSTSMAWLQALETRLSNCATVAALTRSDTLSFVRRSSLGFTAVELQFLADWLESPDFPRGLTTFVAPAPPLPSHSHRHATNSVAPSEK